MHVAKACRTEDRVDLLSVRALLYTLLTIVHDAHHVLHLLVQTCEVCRQVVYLEDVTTKSCVHVEIAELIVIKSQQLCVDGAVLEDLLSQLTSVLTRSCLGDILLEGHVVEVGTDSTLNLQVIVDIIDDLTSEAVDILL